MDPGLTYPEPREPVSPVLVSPPYAGYSGGSPASLYAYSGGSPATPRIPESTPDPLPDSYSRAPPSPTWSLEDSIDGSLPNWKDHIQQIPFLSDPRPRALTPPGFQDEDIHEQDKRPRAILQQSPWFKLPPYVRQDILQLAFGDKGLHMSLFFKAQDRHEDESIEAQDTSVNGSWQWWGSVCNRPVRQGVGPMTRGGNRFGPWDDSCRQKHPDKQIGIMGWLLSCRQNYAEAIELLYSKNTIMISGDALISYITQLLPPQRLAVITKLEVRWDLESYFHEEEDFRTYQLDEDHVSRVLNSVSPTRFPKIKELYISFEGDLHYEDNAESVSPEMIDSIIRQFIEFVERWPKHLKFAFALPTKIFSAVTKGVCTGLRNPKLDRKSYCQAWCSSDGSLAAIQIPFKDSYPEPPFHLDGRQGIGFWLLEGMSGGFDPPSKYPYLI